MVRLPLLMDTEVLVLGSGLAGLVLALKLADSARVLICTKTSLRTANSAMAQGGIAAVMAEDDSFDRHVADTLAAGAGLCRVDVVRHIVEQGPDRIRDLTAWGVKFDVEDASGGGRVDLTREGGHSARRILHIADHTGLELHSHLLERVLEHPNIVVWENNYAVDLLLNVHVEPFAVGPRRCLGAYILDKATGQVKAVRAASTFLATGGAGKVYLYTSNWEGATGDGIAMAYRAGARVANLEFMQFHPTCLYHPSARNFLISEALRGEGGELVDRAGRAFTKDYTPQGSLAPRDIVARSIDAEMKRTGSDCVFLDMRTKSRDYLAARFPVIYKRCLELGIDMSREPIPVVPAAHYLCGGVVAGADGATDVQGLFALGEAACTGLHGANRLASNSLLECLAVSHSASVTYLRSRDEFVAGARSFLTDGKGSPVSVPGWKEVSGSGANREPSERARDSHTSSLPDEMVVIHHMWDEIRRLMWNYVGIVRTDRRLERAANRLAMIQQEISDYYSAFKPHSDIEELRNIALVAQLTVRCALARKESRGIHYNLDYPELLPVARDTVL